MPSIASLLVLAVGLLALLGLGRRLLAGVASAILLLLWAGTLVALYLHGQGGGGDLPAWQQGLTHLGLGFSADALAFALPLAAAVAEHRGA
jgi:hypothetical protein